MAWAPWSCPVDCSLPSSEVTKVAPYGGILGPGVVAGFVVTAGVIVLAVTANYFFRSDAYDGIHSAQKNLVDEIVLGSTRSIGRTTISYANRLVPRRISSGLSTVLGQAKTSRVYSISLLALGDIQLCAGLAILITGFISLCPSSTEPNGLPAYHWQTLFHLVWLSVVTQQGTLFLLPKYLQDNRWKKNVRLSLTYALLVLLTVAILPTASFNWYSKRYLGQFHGPSDSRGIVPDDWQVTYHTLAKSAAQPVSPTLCYFDPSSVNNLYRSADPCHWSDFTPVNPPQLTAAAACIVRGAIMYEKVNLTMDTGNMPRLSHDEAGFVNSSSPSSYFDSSREQYCDLHTPISGTVSFQTALIGMASVALLCSLNAVTLFGSRSFFFRRRIRLPISRYSRCVIEKISNRAMHMFPMTGHKPDLVEGVVTTPLLALHLTGRLALDMFTSKLAKVLLLMFSFAYGCIRLYPAHDPYAHQVPHEGWTFGQVLAAALLLSPLALVVHELFKCRSRAWHASSNGPAHPTQTESPDDPIQGYGIKFHDKNERDIESDGTRPEARQAGQTNDKESDGFGPDGVTSSLDSPELRSFKWTYVAVWLLVITLTLLGSAQLLYIYLGHADPGRLSVSLFIAFTILPVSYYAWVLMAIHIWRETAHYNSGYRHGSRLITCLTTPKASQLMMLTAAWAPLGIISWTLIDVLEFLRPFLNTPRRIWAIYMLCGSYGAIAAYFAESIMVNVIIIVRGRSKRVK